MSILLFHQLMEQEKKGSQMKRKAGAIVVAAIISVLLSACDCGRKDGCFGDGDYDGKKNKPSPSALVTN